MKVNFFKFIPPFGLDTILKQAGDNVGKSIHCGIMRVRTAGFLDGGSGLVLAVDVADEESNKDSLFLRRWAFFCV